MSITTYQLANDVKSEARVLAVELRFDKTILADESFTTIVRKRRRGLSGILFGATRAVEVPLSGWKLLSRRGGSVLALGEDGNLYFLREGSELVPELRWSSSSFCKEVQQALRDLDVRHTAIKDRNRRRLGPGGA